MNTLTTYLEQCGLLSLEKQDKLAFVIGEQIHQLNLDEGKIRFDSLEFPFQVLGTESDNTLTWLWAWADEQEEIPANLIAASLELRNWGSNEGIPEFSTPSLDLTRADGFLFSLIASEVCRASCYYRDVYEGGSLFVLLFDRMIDSQPSFDLGRLSKQFLNLISRSSFNHRSALHSYLTKKRLSPKEGVSRIACLLESGELLSAEFDESGSLQTLNGEAVML
jgi:hypothetical protein